VWVPCYVLYHRACSSKRTRRDRDAPLVIFLAAFAPIGGRRWVFEKKSGAMLPPLCFFQVLAAWGAKHPLTSFVWH